ncbi:MAG: serine/threonine-protein kinase [Planctomycetota bacterium]|nr:serine/threonine-protein kinase [Planctomycetota bacterium]
MTKTKLIESTEKFAIVLERSQLFAASQLEAIKKLAETAEDPIQIARALLKNTWLTKWQASQLLSGFYNLTLGKYRLVDYLGKGELGNVYLAENPKLGRKVALKTLSKKHTGTPELVKHFLDEASAAAALDHRNIVHIHDVSSEGQRHYVVMEYISGRDLQSRVDADGRLSFADAASFVRQAAEGLRHAHEQGVIHRDVKPANIMVDDQGVAKILDMGVGHLRKAASNPSENTGELMMSAIAYMAPEHARGQDVDARCDVYSLGGVLYFLLTARAPFSTKTDAERVKIKESKRPIPLGDLRADTPQPLVELCERMMELKPDDRCASMADVLAALAGAEDLTPAVAAGGEDAEMAEAEPGEIEIVELDEAADEAAPEAKKTEPEAKVESKAAAPAAKIDVGSAAKPASAVMPTDFAINTKKRKKKPAAAPPPPAAKAAAEKPVEEKASKPAAAASDAVATGDKPQPAAAERKNGLSKALIIGGACAAGLLLIAGVGIGAMMLLRGGDTEVAQTTPTETDDTDEPAGETQDSGNAAEPTPSDETGGASAITPAADPFAAPDATTTDVPASDAATTPSANTTEPAVGTGDVAAVAPAAAAVTTDATPPAEPEKTNTEPAPESPTPEVPAEVKPAEVTPEPEKKPEPKPAPPKTKTFAFEPAVDLPVPAADAPELTLGQVNIRPEDTVFISLDGGDIAAAGRIEFSLQNAQDGVAPRDWEFYLSDGNTDPVVIATMSMPEKDLKFKWAPAGVANATATNLRNCSLKITAGKDQPQDLALRTPQKVAPITIDVEKSATAKLPLEGAPDRSSLKMEVTVKGHKSMVEPAQIELGKGGEAFIYFGESREQAAFALKLDASLNARGVQIKTDPYIIVPVEKSPVKLNKASIKKYEAFQAQQAVYQSRIFDLQKLINENKVPPQQKPQAQAALAEGKQQLELIDKTVAKMSQLQTDMAAVGAGASLQFRVFSDTFEKQIDLIVTDSNAAPAAP